MQAGCGPRARVWAASGGRRTGEPGVALHEAWAGPGSGCQEGYAVQPAGAAGRPESCSLGEGTEPGFLAARGREQPVIAAGQLLQDLLGRCEGAPSG